MPMVEDEEQDFGDELPVGYRFLPTDEELVTHYLINKVLCNSFTASVFKEINATELYNKHPRSSVQFSSGEKEWFFFIYKNRRCDYMQNKAIQIVGDELGFWQSNGKKPILDTNGNILAFKIHLTYFSGCLSKSKKTHWKMDEYRLPFQFYTLHSSKEEWVVGRLTRGRNYNLF